MAKCCDSWDDYFKENFIPDEEMPIKACPTCRRWFRDEMNPMLKYFPLVWSEWIKRVDKGPAYAAFRNHFKTEADVSKLRCAIGNYRNECIEQGRKRGFIMNGATFFNGRWEDYLEVDNEPLKQVVSPTNQCCMCGDNSVLEMEGKQYCSKHFNEVQYGDI